MTALALAWLRGKWPALVALIAAAAYVGWLHWRIADALEGKREAEQRLELATKRLELADAMARAASAEATAQAFESARVAAMAAAAAKDRAEKVRKEIAHAEDGDVAPVLRAVLDGLRGE